MVAVSAASAPSGTHGRELVGRQAGEAQGQVGHVALGVDDQRRDAGAERLLEQHHAEAGLARPGHAHDDPVRGEVGGVVVDPIAGPFVLRGVDGLTEEEVSPWRET